MQGIGANTGPFRVRSVQNGGMTIKSGGAFSLSSAEREGNGVMVTKAEREGGGEKWRWVGRKADGIKEMARCESCVAMWEIVSE